MQLHMRSVSDNGYIVNESNENPREREMKPFGETLLASSTSGTGVQGAGDGAQRTESQTQLLVQTTHFSVISVSNFKLTLTIHSSSNSVPIVPSQNKLPI